MRRQADGRATHRLLFKDVDAPLTSSTYAENWVGMPDEQWLLKVLKDGWIIVSVDQGKAKTQGRALPDICEEADCTHIMGSTAFHERRQAEEVQLFAGISP